MYPRARLACKTLAARVPRGVGVSLALMLLALFAVGLWTLHFQGWSYILESSEGDLAGGPLSAAAQASAVERALHLAFADGGEGEGGRIRPEVAVSVFKRHCGWEPPEGGELMAALRGGGDALPLLIQAAFERCEGESALPFVGVDTWHDHADVRVVDEKADVAALEAGLDAACNARGGARGACVVFSTPRVLRSGTHGAALLLRVLQRPFVLITADNEDECVPWRGAPVYVCVRVCVCVWCVWCVCPALCALFARGCGSCRVYAVLEACLFAHTRCHPTTWQPANPPV
jgi:hypothetical protein